MIVEAFPGVLIIVDSLLYAGGFLVVTETAAQSSLRILLNVPWGNMR